MTLYIGHYAQGGGYYLTDANGPNTSMYFRMGNPSLVESKPTYFEKENDAIAAGQAAGYEIKKKP